jgi:predicted acyl esterase
VRDEHGRPVPGPGKAVIDRTGGGRCSRGTRVRHQTLDDWWEPLRYQHRIGEVDLPVLHISGWYDDEEIATPATSPR